MNKLFYENILTENINLPCNLLGSNIDSIILKKLKDKIGNKCIKEGYVENNSIQIIKRTIGEIDKMSLNGDIQFLVNYKALICNPLQNNIIECVVDDNNKLGIVAINKPLEIILNKRHHENKEFFKDLKKNDKIIIKVIEKSFNINDNSIIVIGKYVSKI